MCKEAGIVCKEAGVICEEAGNTLPMDYEVSIC